MPAKESTTTHCSFCHRSIDVVDHVITGPPPNESFPEPQAAICNLCIIICFDELPDLEAKRQRKEERSKKRRLEEEMEILSETAESQVLN